MIPVNSGPGYLIIALDFLTCLTRRADLVRIWQAEKKTVLFVTQDIEEAVPLAVGSSAAVASDGNPTGLWLTSISKFPYASGRQFPCEVSGAKDQDLRS